MSYYGAVQGAPQAVVPTSADQPPHADRLDNLERIQRLEARNAALEARVTALEALAERMCQYLRLTK